MRIKKTKTISSRRTDKIQKEPRHSPFDLNAKRTRSDLLSIQIGKGEDQESVLASRVGNGKYRIESLAFSKKVALDDIVEAHEEDGRLVFKQILQPSGNQTLNVLVRGAMNDPSKLLRMVREFTAHSLYFEFHAPETIMVNLPPGVEELSFVTEEPTP